MIEKDKPGPTTSRRGRPKGSQNRRTWFAREWAEKVGCDPIEFMSKVLASDTIEVLKSDAAGKIILGPDGKAEKELAAVPLDVRIECAKTLAGYMYPRLQATQIAGPGGGPVPIEDSRMDIERLMADPKLVAAATALALASMGTDVKELPPSEFTQNHTPSPARRE
jgi:hypothetical protein